MPNFQGKLLAGPTWTSSWTNWLPMGLRASRSLRTALNLPARRRRLYIFLVRVDGNPLLCFQDRSVDSIFTTFGGLLGGCTRTGPCASSILLTDEDAAVLAELRFRQKRRAELSQNQPDKPVAGDWADQHMKMAQSMNVRWGVAPPTELASNPWFATLTEREKDALPLLQAHLPKTLMRDLSQSLGRANAATWKPEIGKHIAPTMLPKMNVWVEPAGHVKRHACCSAAKACYTKAFQPSSF